MNSQVSPEGALIRLRFLRDTGRDSYVRVTEVPNCFGQEDGERSSEETAEQKVAREREIFLRASLQLLNHKEALTSSSSSAAARKVKGGGDECEMYDVIRLGILRKFSRNSKFSSITAANLSHWKVKYVEVRHGVLSYDDYHGSGSQLSYLHELRPSETSHHTRRFIHLSIDSCICRVVQTGHSGSRIFEIAVVGGPRRFWMTNTPDECMEWVKAIHAAMVGSSFGRIRGLDLSENCATLHSNLIMDGGDLPPPLSISDENPFRSKTHSNSKQDLSWLSMEGAAAPYAEDMSLFMHLHNSFVEAEDESTYKRLLQGLHREQVQITIPVLFIKSKTKLGNFVLSPQDSLNAHNFVPLFNSSQVWKDLQRDVIIVNGERVSGELGAEAMIGALVRHISDKAEQIKLLQQKQIIQRMSGSDTPEAAQLSNSEFTISESLIVECARDLIVLCNRTQSGGDTYFCVEALLCGDRSESKTILTPFSAEADPLSFTVDAVLVTKNHALPRSLSSGAPLHAANQVNKPIHHPLGAEVNDLSPSGMQNSVNGQSVISPSAVETPVTREGSGVEAHRDQVEELGSMPSSEQNVARRQSRRHHLVSPTAEKRRSHISSVRVNAMPLDENEADVSDSYRRNSKKDKKKFASTTTTAAAAAAADDEDFGTTSLHLGQMRIDSNQSETSDNESQQRNRTPRRRRRPQLDLRGELEMDGFQFFSRQTSALPLRPSADSMEPSSNASFPQIAKTTSLSVELPASCTSPLAPADASPPQRVFLGPNCDVVPVNSAQSIQTLPYEMSALLQPHFSNDVPFIVGQKDEEYSVISELTLDTYTRVATKPFNLSQEDQVGVATAEPATNGGGDPTTPSGSREQKSLFKHIGKSLKPFRMPTVSESLEGISSPFRNMRRRGSNSNKSASEVMSLAVNSTSSGAGQSKDSATISENEACHKKTRPRRNTETLLQEQFRFFTRSGYHANHHHHHQPQHYLNSSIGNSSGNNHQFHHRETNDPMLLSDYNMQSDFPRGGGDTFMICIRVRVQAVSRYKVCTSNPSGDESVDTWASICGAFSQSFLIGANGGHHLGMADRLVSIEVENCNFTEDAQDPARLVSSGASSTADTPLASHEDERNHSS